jgi:superfamily II DNA or RNA helicase
LVVETLASKRTDTALLGLTATPGRTWNDKDEDRKLAHFFGKKKVSLSVAGYSSPVDFLIDEGYLAKPTFKTLLNESSNGLTGREVADLSSRFDIPPAVLKRIAANEQRSLKIIDATEDLLTRHKRVLMFATTVDHARLMATVLRARGHDADLVTAETPTEVRAATIERFRSDSPEPMVLCNYGILTAGFDAPATSAALIARPTFSLVEYSQMVGRAIRGPKAGGNKAAEILTVVDTDLPGFRDVSEAFTNWEDVWNE